MIELVEEIGKRTTNVTSDPKETAYLFQQLSVALQRSNAVSFQSAFGNSLPASALQSVTFSST